MYLGKRLKISVYKGVAVAVASLLCFYGGFGTLTVYATEAVTSENVEDTDVLEENENVEDTDVLEENEFTEELVFTNSHSDDNDQNFAGYVEQLMYEDLPQSESMFGDSEDVVLDQNISVMSAFTSHAALFGQLNAFEQAIYNTLLEEIKMTASGELDSSSFEKVLYYEGSQSAGTYTFPLVKKSFIELGASDKDEAKAKIVEMANVDMKKIHEALLYDNPYDLYWYDKVTGASLATANSYSIYTNKTTGAQSIAITKITVVAKFSVSTDFCTNETTTVSGKTFYLGVDTSKTGAAKNAVTEAKNVVEAAKDKSDYEKICYYRDYILEATSYNSAAIYNDEDYGNPWQLIWVFDKDASTKVVCEGYAKSFKYLCDLSDFENDNIRCLLMGGSMKSALWSTGEGHMWNILQMDNGKNYLVDLTNSDSGTSGAGGYLFLKGYKETGTDNSENRRNSKLAEYYYMFSCGYSSLYYYDYISLDRNYGEDGELTSDDYDKQLKYAEAENCHYSGTAVIPEFTVYTYTGDIVESDKYTFEASNNINACDKSQENAPLLCITALDNYCGQISCNFTIESQDISDESVFYGIVKQKNSDGYYNLLLEMAFNNKSLGDEDYSYEVYKAGAEGVNISTVQENGDYVLKVEGKGNFYGTRNVPVTIDDIVYGVLQEDIPEGGISEGIWVAGLEEHYKYTGSAIKPDLHVYDSDKRLVEGRDYQIAYSNNVNAGIARITLKGINDYYSTRVYNFQIDKIYIDDESVLTTQGELYKNGTVLRPVPKSEWNGRILKNKSDYTVEYYAADMEWNITGDKITGLKEAGNYIAVITGIGNFTGKRQVRIVVNQEKKTLASLTALSIHYQKYSKAGVRPPITVRDGKYTLIEGTDYNAYYPSQEGVGTAYVVLTGIGKYTGTRTLSFNIIGTHINTLGITGIPTSCTYSGALKEFSELKVYDKSTNEALIKDTDYRVEWLKNENAGVGQVVITGMGGYYGTVRKSFNILPDTLTDNSDNVTVYLKQSNVAFSKNGAKPEVVVSYKCENGTRIILEQGKDYKLVYRNNKQVNSVLKPTVEVNFKGNFRGTIKREFTIIQKKIDALDIEVLDRYYVKGLKQNYKTSLVIRDSDGYSLSAGKDFDKNFIYSYVDDTVVINDGKSVVRAAGTVIEGSIVNDIIPANTTIAVKVNAKENGNYSGSITGTFRIAERKVSYLSVKIKSQKYTGRPIILSEDDITVTYGKNEILIPGTDYEIVEGSYENNIKKGRAKVTIKGIGRYGGTRNVTFNITARDMNS